MLHALSLGNDWGGQPRWCILEIGFDAEQNFLSIWQAWRRDPRRPAMLHYVAIEPQLQPLPTGSALRNGYSMVGELVPLAAQLAARCWGLTQGFHRFSFERGQLLLTLCVGSTEAMLREQRFEADSIWLGMGPSEPWLAADAHVGKALARRCRRGTRVAGRSLAPQLRDVLRRSGFVPEEAPPGLEQSSCENAPFLRMVFDPGWTPRSRHDADPAPRQSPSSALVIGAGIAGAAVAASLARRGLSVQLLDARPAPALGASSLPAGLFVPQLSADDSIRSKLSRAGLRATIEFAQQQPQQLESGRDWCMSGVLELREDAVQALSGIGGSVAGRDWSEEAPASIKAAAGLSALSRAVWHRRAGWMRPAALVRALLSAHASSRIEFVAKAEVKRLVVLNNHWRALGPDDAPLAQASLVVLTAGHASAALAPAGLPLQSVRGQLSCSRHAVAAAAPLLPFPVNGHGSFLPDVPLESGRAWFLGATYQRDDSGCEVRGTDHLLNHAQLRELLPDVAARLEAAFLAGNVQGWAGMRAVTPDRLPLVGPLVVAPAGAAVVSTAEPQPALWICSAMGSRGLTFALCCAELLAARLFGEPLPLETRLAKALDVRRFASSDAELHDASSPKQRR